MARIKISPEDIHQGLPPYCVYCGEQTDDAKQFLLERSKLGWDILLPYCEEHDFTMVTVKYVMNIAMVLCLMVFSVMCAIGYPVVVITFVTQMVLLIVFVSLQSHWFPQAVYLSRKQQVSLRNVHPQFCQVLSQRRTEASDGPD
ncbi:MAG: hypothetical protein ACRC8S_12225 [Fimbriiglobus sp.]